MNLILPQSLTQPKEGDDINVLGGPAGGRLTQWTGKDLIYVERHEGEERHHLYTTVEKEHLVTGERIWVYEYQDHD